MVGRLRADPEQKQDFGDRTVTQGIDTQRPITEALLWQFLRLSESDAAVWASLWWLGQECRGARFAHGREARLRRPVVDSFFPRPL